MLPARTRVLVFFAAVFVLATLSVFSTTGFFVNVFLISPQQANVSQNPSITFMCNASTNSSITSISLYHNINGSFSLNSTLYFGQLAEDSATLLLCHFNGEYACSDETANHTGTSFERAVIGEGIHIDGNDKVSFPIANNIDISEGTLELWLRSPSNLTEERWIFIAGDDSVFNNNEIRLWISGGTLYFRIYNEYETPNTVTRNISDWENGSWHYLVAEWNTITGGGNDWDWMDLFVDGSNASNTYNIQDLVYMGAMSNYMYLGSYKDGTKQINSTIDEFRISNSKKTGSQINQTYQSFFSYKNVSANWTISGIPDGTYIWNCLSYAIDGGSNWSYQNRTFYVDSYSPPSVNSIILSPNSTDDVDPGVSVNVTANITDASGVHTAVFQYKRSGISSWTNLTMTNSSPDEWRANFTLASPPDTWYYRIWSNDTLGHSGYSEEMNITAQYDYSWHSSPANMGEHFIYFGSTESIGTIAINNTGDYPLNFRISSDFQNTFFNISNPDSFDIAAKDVVYIGVNVTAPGEPGEYPVLITVNATSESANPSLAYINATIVSYWGGPYLTMTVAEYDNIVEQSTSGINYSVRVRNIGNETASSVWINWTFPSGWSVSWGNLTLFAGNMTNGSVTWNNVSVNLGSTAAAGVSYVYANSSSNENASANASIKVSVVCSSDDGVCGSGCSYVSDSDCSVPSQGTSTSVVSGSGFVVIEYAMNVFSPERIEAVRGVPARFTVFVSNPSKNTLLQNVTLTMSGYPLSLTTIRPSQLNLSYGQKKPFIVSMDIPDYLSYGARNLNIRASAYASYALLPNKTLISNSTTALLVIGSSTNFTQNFSAEARAIIDEISSMGADTASLEELAERIERYANESRKDEARSLLETLEKRMEEAQKARELINRSLSEISFAKSLGLKPLRAEMFASLAVSAFSRGDFERASERALAAMHAYDSEARAVAETLFFVKSNFLAILSVITAALLFSLWFRKKAMLAVLSARIKRLEAEERGIIELVRKAQTEFYARRAISKEEYSSRITGLEKDLAETARRRVQAAIRMKTLLHKGDRISILEKEKRNIKRRIGKLQSDYFGAGKFGKTIYERLLNSLLSELDYVSSLIDKERGKRRPVLAVAVLLVLALSIPLASAYSEDQSSARDAITRAEKELAAIRYGKTYANDTLNEAKELFALGHYAAAEEFAKKVMDIKREGLSLSRAIDDIEAEIYLAESAGFNMSRARESFERALDAFSREDFPETRRFLEEASRRVDEIRQSSTPDYFEMLANNLAYSWHILAAFCASLVAFLFLMRRVSKRRTTARVIRNLKRKERSFAESIKRLQKQYFEEMSISKHDYERMMERYRQAMMRVQKKRLAIEATFNKAQQKTYKR